MIKGRTIHPLFLLGIGIALLAFSVVYRQSLARIPSGPLAMEQRAVAYAGDLARTVLHPAPDDSAARRAAAALADADYFAA